MKILFLFLALITGVSAIAQEEQLRDEKMDLLLVNYKNRLDVLKIQDDLLKSLLKIPFEKRVYVYPALFESNTIPKKIVTHPQIIVWKGKKPTKIAPQMQEFAKEHLDYMPAKFYPLLDPDVWPKRPNKEDWHSVGEMLDGIIISPTQSNRDAILNETK